MSLERRPGLPPTVPSGSPEGGTGVRVAAPGVSFKRMTNETLRDTVSQWCPFDYMGPPEDWATALLAEIGLDDLDAAFERANNAMAEWEHVDPEACRRGCERIIAAFLATAEPYPSTDNRSGDNDGEA